MGNEDGPIMNEDVKRCRKRKTADAFVVTFLLSCPFFQCVAKLVRFEIGKTKRDQRVPYRFGSVLVLLSKISEYFFFSFGL